MPREILGDRWWFGYPARLLHAGNDSRLAMVLPSLAEPQTTSLVVLNRVHLADACPFTGPTRRRRLVSERMSVAGVDRKTINDVRAKGSYGGQGSRLSLRRQPEQENCPVGKRKAEINQQLTGSDRES